MLRESDRKQVSLMKEKGKEEVMNGPRHRTIDAAKENLGAQVTHGA